MLVFLNFIYQATTTPLHLAIQCGNDDIVNLLLEEGADVNAEDGVSSVRCDIHTQFDYFSVISLYTKLPQNLLFTS